MVDDLGIDDTGVRFSGLLLRVQHELDGSALWAECTRIEDVEAFVNGVAVADALLQLERMDWRDLGIAAESAHPQEARFEVLDGGDGDLLCPRGAARDSRPETLDEFWRHADQKHRWKILDILGPVAELHQRPWHRLLCLGATRPSAAFLPADLLRLVPGAIGQDRRDEGDIEVRRGDLIRVQAARAVLHGVLEGFRRKRPRGLDRKMRAARWRGVLHPLLHRCDDLAYVIDPDDAGTVEPILPGLVLVADDRRQPNDRPFRREDRPPLTAAPEAEVRQDGVRLHAVNGPTREALLVTQRRADGEELLPVD